MSPSAHVLPGRLLLLLTTLVSLFLLFSSRVQAEQPMAVESHVVSVGDTLWAIAADHTLPGDDVRATVSAIRGLNGLPGSSLEPGQVVVVPVLSDP